MTRRCLAVLLLLALAAPASALSQGSENPFGPLPQPPPPIPEEPAPQPVDGGADNDEDGFSGNSIWLIVGASLLLFLVVGFLIVRDMRRTVGTRRTPRRRRGSGQRPAGEAKEALAGDGRPRTGSQKARAKAQQRAKTKAARKQRRRARSR